MKIYKVIELFPYSYADLTVFLNDEAISKLINLNMLRRLGKKDLYEVEDLLHEDGKDILDKMNGDMYVFRFVGLVTIQQVCLISYPKYYKGDNGVFEKTFDAENEIIRELIDVITKYEADRQSQELIPSDSVYSEFNLLAFTLDLLNDYYNNGLYSNDKEVVELNGQGSILWDKTIAEQTMYLSDEDPIYLDFYTANTDINYTNVIRQIHATILTQCCVALEPVLRILSIQPVVLSERELSDFGDNSYITYLLHREYTTQFVTHKLQLINKLIDYVNKANSAYDKSDIAFVGTKAMNMVWESVCALVEGDCSKIKLEQLNLKLPKYLENNCCDVKTVKDLIPCPNWVHSSGVEHKVKDTLIPDIVVIRDKEIIIYDAKYYNIVFNEEMVKNEPGIGDITKQYLYQKAYKPLAEANDLEMSLNAFLMPYSGDEKKILGETHLDLFMHDDLLPITTILLPAREMYQKYLSL